MRRRHKMKSKKISDRIFLLLAVFLIGYVMFANREEEPQQEEVKNAFQAEETKTEGASLAERMSMSLELKDHPYGSVLDFKQGEGEPVQCGQEVQLAYTTILLDGEPVESRMEANEGVRFQVGRAEDKVIPGISRYTMGMRLGGERQVTLSPEMAYDAKGFRRKDVPMGSPVIARLRLEGLKQDDALYFMRSGIYTIRNDGPQRQASCGDEVTVLLHDVTHKDTREKLPAEEGHTVRFTTGAREVPFWLEQAVVGNGKITPLRLGGMRSVLLDEELQGKADTKDWEGLKALGVKGNANLRVHLLGIGAEKVEAPVVTPPGDMQIAPPVEEELPWKKSEDAPKND